MNDISGDEYWERWYAAIRERYAVRRFDGRPVEDKDVAQLHDCASMLREVFDDIRIAIVQVEEDGLADAVDGIKGAKMVAAFIGDADGEQIRSRIGFLGELFLLECTCLDLKTCWVGGAFDKHYCSQIFEIGEDETIYAVSPIGYADAAPSDAHDDRLPMAELCESEKYDQAVPAVQEALQLARLAPSSMNRQPWRFILEAGEIRIEKRLHLPLGNKMLEIDNGIAAAHMEAALRQNGIHGTWEFLPDAIVCTY